MIVRPKSKHDLIATGAELKRKKSTDHHCRPERTRVPISTPIKARGKMSSPAFTKSVHKSFQWKIKGRSAVLFLLRLDMHLPDIFVLHPASHQVTFHIKHKVATKFIAYITYFGKKLRRYSTIGTRLDMVIIQWPEGLPGPVSQVTGNCSIGRTGVPVCWA